VGVQVEDTQICVVMVGLPARGKSLIAQKGSLPVASLANLESPC
jgi:6-phosphofructo-2-kinase/fructose-2,6-biphosphatase 2